MQMDRIKSFLLRVAYVAVLVGIGYLCIRYLLFMLLPMLMGLLIAYFLRPVTHFLSRHSKITVKSASIVAAVIFYSILAGALWLAGSWLVLEGQRLLQSFPEWYPQTVEPVLQNMYRQTLRFLQIFSTQANTVDEMLFAQFSEGIQGALSELLEGMLGGLTEVLQSVPMLLLTLLFTVVSSVLICADYSRVTEFILAQIPTRLHSTLLGIRDFLVGIALRMMKAYLILMLLTFVELTAGLWILKIPHFWLIAACIAVLDLLPVVGSGVILIPWSVYQICEGNYFTGSGLLILWAIVSVVRQIIEPKIVGQQLGLHPLLTLSAMYCGAYLAGFWGLLIAPVLCLLVKYLQENGMIKVYKPLPPA